MRRDRQQALQRKLVIIGCILFGFGAGLTCYAVVKLDHPLLAWLCAGFTGLVLLLFRLAIGIMQRYMQNVIVQLSEMIGALYDLREEELVSVLDDDLLSKLQSQVLKLMKMMRAHQNKLRTERDEIKSLISDISHQLKTPLANLEMYCTFLQEGDLDEQQRREFSGHVQSQLDKLSWLMESMIKMSRLESGIIQLHLKPGNLVDTIMTALKQVHEKAKQKAITVYFDPSVQELILPHDPRWTAEALFNLLDNAVKYTSDGGQVQIRMERYELYARIDIQDTGTGLAEIEIPRVFARFYRGENSRDTEGVGIGLYLAREIVSQQNGYIKASSNQGEGSVFSVFMLLSEHD